MTTTATTRHSARCKTEVCNRFVATGKPHCGACDASYTRGRAASDGAVKRLMEDLRAAREAAVADHAAHEAEMETLHAQLAERTQERDAAYQESEEYLRRLGVSHRDVDDTMALVAERTHERDDARGANLSIIAQRDALSARLASVNRRDWFLLAWAIVATIAAVAGWV